MLEPGPYLALIYDYVEDALEARKPYRDAHLAALGAAKQAGLLANAGALGDPPSGGILVFIGDDRSVAEAFAASDPYVLNGVVTAWRVEPWTVSV